MFSVRLPLIATALLATGCSVQTMPHGKRTAAAVAGTTKIVNVVRSASTDAAPKTRTTIGRWRIGKRPVTIYRINDDTFIRQNLGNGRSVTKRVKRFRHKLGPAYRHKSETWIIDRDGDLQSWRNGDYLAAAKPAN
ncbi:MAG: hypothetical protein ACR2PI_00010 [Hyphomicrobiaceae bacterium]